MRDDHHVAAADARRREAQDAAVALAARHADGGQEADDIEVPADDGAIAILHLDDSREFHSRIKSARGIKWSHIAFILKEKAPEHAVRTDSDWRWALDLVQRALDELYPGQWTRDRRPDDKGNLATFVMLKEYVQEVDPDADGNPGDTAVGAAQAEEQPPF